MSIISISLTVVAALFAASTAPVWFGETRAGIDTAVERANPITPFSISHGTGRRLDLGAAAAAASDHDFGSFAGTHIDASSLSSSAHRERFNEWRFNMTQPTDAERQSLLATVAKLRARANASTIAMMTSGSSAVHTSAALVDPGFELAWKVVEFFDDRAIKQAGGPFVRLSEQALEQIEAQLQHYFSEDAKNDFFERLRTFVWVMDDYLATRQCDGLRHLHNARYDLINSKVVYGAYESKYKIGLDFLMAATLAHNTLREIEHRKDCGIEINDRIICAQMQRILDGFDKLEADYHAHRVFMTGCSTGGCCDRRYGLCRKDKRYGSYGFRLIGTAVKQTWEDDGCGAVCGDMEQAAWRTWQPFSNRYYDVVFGASVQEVLKRFRAVREGTCK